MPINLESTLQGIRRGAAAPGVPGTLAGQIRAQKQKQQRQQFEMQRGLQELMMDQAATQSEMRRRAAKTSKEQREALLKRQFGVVQGAFQAARSDPQAAAQMLSQSPRVAQWLSRNGVDIRNPDPEKLRALRDQLYAQSEGKLPPTQEQETDKRSVYIRPDTPEGKALGLDQPAEVKYEGPSLVADPQDPEYNVTGFQYVGPQQEAGPTRYQEEVAGIRAGRFEEVSNAAQDAPVRLARVQQMRSALAGGAETGFAGETRQGISQALELAGLDPEKVAPGILSSGASTEVIDAASNQLAVELLSAQEGRTSRLELKTVKRALPELTKTPEGNEILLEVLENKAMRDQQLGTIANIFAGTPAGALTRETEIPGVGEMPKGTTLSGAIAAYDKGNPIITEDLENKIQEAGSEPRTPPKDPEGNIKFDQMRENQTYRIGDEDYIFKGYSEEQQDYILEPE